MHIKDIIVIALKFCLKQNDLYAKEKTNDSFDIAHTVKSY